MQETPLKDFYKLSEVCQLTDTQPYVLRFWESEFPQLKPGKTASGQRMYRENDVALVCRIKELLYDEEQTLEAARQMLADELARGLKPMAARTSRRPSSPAPTLENTESTEASTVGAAEPSEPDNTETAVNELETVSRQRYEDAVDEIDHLRLGLREADKAKRRAEERAEQAEQAAELERQRADRAVGYLERLRQILS